MAADSVLTSTGTSGQAEEAAEDKLEEDTENNEEQEEEEEEEAVDDEEEGAENEEGDDSGSDEAAADEEQSEEQPDKAQTRDQKVQKEQKEQEKDKRLKKRKDDGTDQEYGVARGIDFKGVKHVVNFDFPTSVASYVHRVGRYDVCLMTLSHNLTCCIELHVAIALASRSPSTLTWTSLSWRRSAPC